MVKSVPLADLIMPLLEKLSNEELEELYKELKSDGANPAKSVITPKLPTKIGYSG